LKEIRRYSGAENEMNLIMLILIINLMKITDFSNEIILEFLPFLSHSDVIKLALTNQIFLDVANHYYKNLYREHKYYIMKLQKRR